jgi:hypothetical protein
MDGFKTKEQVISTFGLPTEKKNDGEYEEYYYDFGTKTVTQGVVNANANATTVAKTTSNYNSGAYKQNANGNAKATVVSQDINYFVRFTFKDTKVIAWKTNGRDYRYYQLINKKTNKEVGKPGAPKFY